MVVFGCGGNRSKLRRYGMGEICAKMADLSILNEDNNRFEKVEDILADIRVGMNKGNPDAKFVEIPDRLDAPVSYTHLDVYKRQGPECRPRFQGAARHHRDHYLWIRESIL